MDDLAFLIKGYDGITDSRSKFKWMCYLVEVCRNQPLQFDGQEINAEFLHANFLLRLYHIGKEDFMDEANDLLYSLRDINRQMYYFVLVATYRLSDDCLIESLENYATKKLKYSCDYTTVCHDDPHKFFHLPRLPWDISPVLNDNLVITNNVNERESIEPEVICPFDSRGVLTSLYSELLSDDTLRHVNSEGSLVFFQFDHETTRCAIIDMLNGISSDIFQEEGGVFSLVNNCKLCNWSICLTKAVLSSKVEAANRIFSLHRCIVRKFDGIESNRLCGVLRSTLEEINELFRSSLRGVTTAGQNFGYCYLDDIGRIVDSQTEILLVYERILESSSVEITQIAYLIRCLRDSALDDHACLAYELLLRGLFTLIAISVCIFVNTGHCEFSDRVFIEATSESPSPDKYEFGEIWKSNLCVDLPCSPDLPSRLCRAVIKQGVLVRILRTASATSFQDRVNILSLYSITSTQVIADVVGEVEKVLTKVESISEYELDQKTLENVVEWVLSSSSMFDVCSVVSSAILQDVRGMCSVIRHLLFCAGGIGFNIEEGKHSHVFKLRAELRTRRFDRRHISAIDIESGTRRLLITPPEPLSIIITKGHARRYVRIYSFLADLTRATSSLSDIELRETKVDMRNRRKLFVFCCSMLRLVTNVRDHVLTELDEVWTLLKDDLENVNTIDHAINAHRRAMKSMMQRTLLDMSNLTTGRTLGVMCESCVRFAYAMNAGDETSASIHYRTFEEHAQLFREKLSVEKANIYARVLLWRIDSSGEFFEDDDASTTNSL